jgi:hypothetical protein
MLSVPGILAQLIGETLRWWRLALRSRHSIEAENLLLRRATRLIAAHISRAGVCAELLEDALLHHELVISGFIPEELGRRLVEKFNFSRRDADQVGAFLRGSKADDAQTNVLTQGAFYTEPANAPHFAFTSDQPATVFITGTGPSDTQFEKDGPSPP